MPANSPSTDQRIDTVVLDMDGTLVDTVYHHVTAWIRAFDGIGAEVPVWRIHRAIGMGSDRLVPEVAGDEVEKAHGDDVRDAHDEQFEAMIDQVHPLPGARDLLAELRRRDVKVVLATSGLPEQTDRLLAVVEGEDKIDRATTSEDAEETKPSPDLIEVAVEAVRGTHAVVVGDAVWDVKAAKEAGCVAVGLLTGGFGEGELRDAGADRVYATPGDLLADLDAVLAGPTG